MSERKRFILLLVGGGPRFLAGFTPVYGMTVNIIESLSG